MNKAAIDIAIQTVRDRDIATLDLAVEVAITAYLAAPTPPAAEAPGQERVAWQELMQQAANALSIFTGHDSQPNLKHRYGERWWEPVNALRDKLVAAVSAPPTYADAEAKGFARGIEAAAKWHDEQAQQRRSQAAEAQGRGDRLRPRQMMSQAYRDEEDAAFIRSLASPAPKGET